MNFDELQKAWQSQNPGAKVTINADVLLKEVRRNQWHFNAMVFWRDVREVGAAFLGAMFFLYFGLIRERSWPSCLLALACLWIGLFMLADRRIQRRKKPATSDPLRACIQASLIQVNHQIWLLRNVFWWYLLPPGIGMAAGSGSVVWQLHAAGWPALRPVVISTVLCAFFFWGVYWLNQYAVRKGLEPRRQELESLLAGLDQ